MKLLFSGQTSSTKSQLLRLITRQFHPIVIGNVHRDEGKIFSSEGKKHLQFKMTNDKIKMASQAAKGIIICWFVLKTLDKLILSFVEIES